MDKLNKFSNLLERIYSAAINPTEFEGLAAHVAKFMGSHSAVIQHRETISGNARIMSITENFSEKSLIDYGEHFYKVDEWVIRGSKSQLGTSFIGSDLIAPNEFENSECYADYGRHLGLYDTVASVFETSTGICAFGVHRDKKEASFDKNDRRLIDLIIPHIKNSLDLNSRLIGESRVNSILLDTLSRNGSAALVVDALLNIKYINVAAESYLKSCKSLDISHNKLRSLNHQIEELVRKSVNAIASLSATRTKEIRILGHEGEASFLLKFAPVPGGCFVNFSAGYLVVIFIERISEPISLDELLIQRYRLTKAESRLAQAVASGETLRHFSERNNLGIETVRTQMKQILSKTGTHRQLDFIKLVTDR